MGVREPAWLSPWPSDSHIAAPDHPELGLRHRGDSFLPAPGTACEGRAWRGSPWSWPVLCPPEPRGWPGVPRLAPAARSFSLAWKYCQQEKFLHSRACVTNRRSRRAGEGEMSERPPFVGSHLGPRGRLCPERTGPRASELSQPNMSGVRHREARGSGDAHRIPVRPAVRFLSTSSASGSDSAHGSPLLSPEEPEPLPRALWGWGGGRCVSQPPEVGRGRGS